MIALTNEEFHSQSLLVYYIIFDAIVMFFTQGYGYIGEKLMVQSEI